MTVVVLFNTIYVVTWRSECEHLSIKMVKRRAYIEKLLSMPYHSSSNKLVTFALDHNAVLEPKI